MSEGPQTSWLLQVDRQVVPVLARELASRAAPQEVGEGWWRWVLPEASTAARLLATGWVRCALRLVAETALPARPTAADLVPTARAIAGASGAAAFVAVTLRRHGRFAAEVAARELGATLAAPRSRETPTLFAAFAERTAFWATATPAASGALLAVAHGPRGAGAARPSRAGAKADEALAVLAAHGIELAPGATVLELGAFPGGITAALAARGLLVDAVDLVPIPAVATLVGVRVLVADVREVTPPRERYDALFCDVNGDPHAAGATVARLAAWLAPGAPVVFTIKLPRWDEATATRDAVVARLAESAPLRCLALRHLAANRQELTYFGQTRL